MTRAAILLAALGIIGLGLSPAHAFTYDQHVYSNPDGSTNFQDPDDSVAGHFAITGGGTDGGLPAGSPFLQSSNPAEASPVVPYDGGAGSFGPFPMAIH